MWVRHIAGMESRIDWLMQIGIKRWFDSLLRIIFMFRIYEMGSPELVVDYLGRIRGTGINVNI